MAKKAKKLARARRQTKKEKKYREFKNADRAALVSLYFGFTPLAGALTITKGDRERARALGENEGGSRASSSPLSLRLEEKTALLRYCEEKKLNEGPQPMELAFEYEGSRSFPKKSGNKIFSLELIGSSGAIVEAILIETTLAILREEGYASLHVHINSVGDRDSFNRFLREFTNYYRRNSALLPVACRQTLKRNPLELLDCTHEKCLALREEAPKSVGFLGEASREHLRETLEYLEELEIPYCLNPLLVGNRSFTTETVFEIRDANVGREEKTLAAGCRYNTLVKRYGWRRDFPAAGIKILLARGKRNRQAAIRFPTPAFFFLQLGTAAKLKSLKVIEILRQAGITLEHALVREKLLSQLSASENSKHPYSLIMGQREALENSTIVRNNTTRSQETLPIAALPLYLKKLLKQKLAR